MQQHKACHPCPQAVPILPQEAIFDETNQISKPVEQKYDTNSITRHNCRIELP